MAAYLIFTRTAPIVDQAEMDAYAAANASHGRTYAETYKLKPLAFYGALQPLEGDAPDGVVLLEFPTKEDALGWYNSPEYQAAAQHRFKGAPYSCVLVEGV